jgi:TATA-binding protein-associated factor Taf7
MPNSHKNVQLLTPLQSHTGVAMANTFQNILEQFGLTEKLHAVNTDNTTSNDTQTTKLDQLDNTFDEENRVRCFNHTLQLSAKALLKPFNIGLSRKATDNDNEITQDDDSDLATFEDEGEQEDEDGEEEEADEVDDEDDNINELEELSEDKQNQVLEETAVVRETVTKVSNLIMKQKMFAISLLTILLI